MPFKSFIIPVLHAERAEQELNRFLGSHRVLAVDRRWVEQGSNCYWAFSVEYAESAAPSANVTASPSTAAASAAKKKVDYKERLSPEDFDVYLQLREMRKEIAAEEGVALYAVFTNEHLAQIAQRRARTKADLLKIPGIGEARAEKYAARVAELLDELASNPNEPNGRGSRLAREIVTV